MNTDTTSLLSGGASLNAIIILPPDSTNTELQTAINNAVTGDIIEISSDITFTSTVTIPLGLAITIQSGADNNFIMSMTVPGFRHFVVMGSLLLYTSTF